MSDGIFELLDKIIVESNKIVGAGKQITADVDNILQAFGAPPIKYGNKYSIIIDRQIHYIEGDEYLIYIRNNTKNISDAEYMVFHARYKTYGDALNAYGRITESMDSYELVDKITPDPNFESQEAADEYLENKDG